MDAGTGDAHAVEFTSSRQGDITGFLGAMNSIARDEGGIVIGACNHVDRIDPAVLRARRLDIKVQMPLPDAFALRAFFRNIWAKRS